MADAEHIPVDFSELFSQGRPEETTSEQKKDFARYCLELYTKQDWKYSSLSEFFADDFKSCTVADFRNFRGELRRELRDILRTRGVYVPKDQNVEIADSLYRVV